MKRRYSVVLTPEPDGSAFNVTSPDIPDLVTYGHTREEALVMAVDCAEALILTYIDVEREIPEAGGPGRSGDNRGRCRRARGTGGGRKSGSDGISRRHPPLLPRHHAPGHRQSPPELYIRHRSPGGPGSVGG